VISGTAAATVQVRPAKSIDDAIGMLPQDHVPSADDLELNFRMDPSVADGEFSNLGWLQELPRPLSKITWDNAAIMSAATAAALGLADAPHPQKADGKLVTLQHAGKQLTAPALVQPGQPDFSITLHLGYGRQVAGKVAEGVGVNAYLLRPH